MDSAHVDRERANGPIIKGVLPGGRYEIGSREIRI